MEEYLENLTRTKSLNDDFVHEDVLENCWKVEIDSLVSLDESFGAYFESSEYSDLTVYVAGKEDGPNAEAKRKAGEILQNLNSYLDIYRSTIGFRWEDGWWKLESLWFPYQIRDIWYMYLSSEYGADYCYCWIKESGSDQYKGVVIDCPGDGSIANVLPTVCGALKFLRECAPLTQDIQVIESVIESRVTIGIDLIKPLIEITEKHRESIPTYLYEHVMKLLTGISENAESS